MPEQPVHSLRPTADEICVAILFGQDPGTAPLDLAGGLANEPRPIIERQIQEAMLRGPLWVAFSGGRDSSALLAIAASVARREGLAMPVPVTMVFPEVTDTDEEGWQRLVLEHLGLVDDWVRIQPGEELDMIGPYAERMLRPHGILLPPNSHAILPMIDAMGAGGTLLSGSGGDELMEGRPQRVSSAVRSRRRVRRVELSGCVIDDLPRPLQARVIRRGHSLLDGFHWLTPAARARLVEEEIAERAASPVRFDALLERAFCDRHFQMGRYAYDLIGADTGTRVLAPFVERDVVAAFARSWGYRFPGARVRSLRGIVGDLLPESILARASKAEFVNVFATERLHGWVREWDG
ncbi:MAG: hypothetical protein JHD16_12130, partial [Solirubrobacteraceae bacterium]|nr:hypothetical protein [Solirubrobacteraceae bacterium]